MITNYKMLSTTCWSASRRPALAIERSGYVRYLVVDELYTFDGAQGGDLACLIRRIKERVHTPPDHLWCVGTSATLGDGCTYRRVSLPEVHPHFWLPAVAIPDSATQRTSSPVRTSGSVTAAGPENECVWSIQQPSVSVGWLRILNANPCSKSVTIGK